MNSKINYNLQILKLDINTIPYKPKHYFFKFHVVHNTYPSFGQVSDVQGMRGLSPPKFALAFDIGMYSIPWIN